MVFATAWRHLCESWVVKIGDLAALWSHPNSLEAGMKHRNNSVKMDGSERSQSQTSRLYCICRSYKNLQLLSKIIFDIGNNKILQMKIISMCTL